MWPMYDDIYRDWLDVYDLQHDTLPDAGFYVELARHLGLTPGDLILELGCGTGRLLAPLVAKGYRVVGVDREAAALDKARERLTPWLPRVQLVQADMRSFTLSDHVSFVFAGLNTLMHLATTDDQLACLRAARRCLKDDGLFVIDLQNPLSFLHDSDGDVARHRFTGHDPRSGDTIMQFSLETLDAAAQRVDLTVITDSIAESGVVTRRLASLSLRLCFRFELEALLRCCSFALDACYGNYDLDSYTADSPRLICVARAI